MPEQKLKANKESMQKFFLQPLGQQVADVIGAMFGLAKGWQKQRDVLQNNFNLGLKCLNDGHFNDAILRFKIVTWMEPKRADAWYYMGCAYMADKKNAPAQKMFTKALALQPDYAEAAYMLAMASGKDASKDTLPKTMPLSLSLAYFEALAAGFTEDQLENLGYEGHTVLCNALSAALTPGRMDHVILELGVGTGLCGPLLRNVAAKITGVDMSAAMLAEAVKVQDEQGNKIYDALINREIGEYLTGTKAESADIVLAANVFSYIGEMGGIVQQVARVLKSGGLFAFTADKMDGQGFELNAEIGRFLFSKPYLERLAAANGLRVLKLEDAKLYSDYSGWLCIFAK